MISSALIPSNRWRSSSWLSCCWKPLNLGALKHTSHFKSSFIRSTHQTVFFVGRGGGDKSTICNGQQQGVHTPVSQIWPVTANSASDPATTHMVFRVTYFLHTCPKSPLGDSTPFLVGLFMSVRKLSRDCVRDPLSDSVMSSAACKIRINPSQTSYFSRRSIYTDSCRIGRPWQLQRVNT